MSLAINGTDGIDFNLDDARIKLGAGDDLQIYHDGSTANAIDAKAGDYLYIYADNLRLNSKTGTEKYITGSVNGAVECYYDNAKKFETTSAGVTITGDLTVTGSAPGGGVDSDGQNNTVAGTNAGDSFTGTDAINNSFYGKDAGTAVTSGDENVAIGYEAFKSATTASQNTCIGSKAGSAVTGGNNVCIGFRAGEDATSIDSCVAVGKSAYDGANTGNDNIAIGAGAMGDSGVTTGGSNTAVGKDALGHLTGGADNVAIGVNAGHAETDGNMNVFIGVQAGDGMENRSDNVAIGYQALTHTGAKNRNTCVGAYAGVSNQNDENTFIGYQAGQGCTTGYYNTCLGHNAGYNLSTGNNIMLLGFNAGTASSPSGVVDDDSTVICLGNDAVTNLYCNDTSISSSDQRDKTDIADFTPGLSFIKQLRPVTYRWDKRSWYTTEKVVTQDQIDNKEFDQGQLGNSIPATAADVLAATPDGSKKNPKQHIGFLAQEVLAVEQSAGFASDKNNMLTVNLTKDETQYGMKYERLVPILVNAIKELETRIATLEAA